LPRLASSAASVRLSELGGLAPHLSPDFSHLTGQILLYVFPPHETARTVLVRAFVQAGQLFPPLPNQQAKPYQFGLKFRCRSLFAINHEHFKALY
jgi:hypothetical protein